MFSARVTRRPNDMLPYARLRPGPGFQLMPSVLYYAQRIIIKPRLRNIAAGSIAAGIRLRHGTQSCGGVDQTEFAELSENGIVLLPCLVDEKQISEIVEYFRTQRVVGPGDMLMGLDALPEGTAMASYPLRTVLECPQVLDVVNDPRVLALAARYLG